MVFESSAAPDISEGLPYLISAAATEAYSSVSDWDVSIGGLGFDLRPSQQTPYIRATERVRKEQVDTSGEPGEQALTSWWTRSQSDWSNGAGIKWYEPGSDEATVSRFDTSHGVDVWTPGQFSLLHLMEAAGSADASTVHLASATVSGVDGYVKVSGDAATWVPSTGSPDSETMAGASGSKPAVAGRLTYIGHAAGIAQIDWSTSTKTEPWTNGGAVRVWWVKNRLIVAIGAALYSLGAGAAAGAITTVGTLIYTHPSSAWTWTDVAEAGQAIIASGYVDGQSGVVGFTIENNASGVPELVGGSPVATMPPGEVIHCMRVYLGNILVLGTSLGVRVGECSPDGQVAYGPLTLETANSVQDVAFRDRFAYVTLTAGLEDGMSGCARIDLSAAADEAERRAWAYDAGTDTAGAATSIALVGDRVVLAANLVTYVQSADDYVASGWLKSGRLRYGTMEPKAFRLVRMETLLNGGNAAISVISPGGTETQVIAFTPSFVTDSDVQIQVAGEPVHQWLQFKVTLTSATASPVVTGLAVKAAPSPGRVRLYQLPLSCFNYERDRYGNTRGTATGAYDRLIALEHAEEDALPLRFQDNRTGEAFTGIIDGLEFNATEPPAGPQNNFGGIIILTARRL